MPAEERARKVAVRKLALGRVRLALIIRRVPAVDDSTVELVDARAVVCLRQITLTNDSLPGQHVFR